MQSTEELVQSTKLMKSETNQDWNDWKHNSPLVSDLHVKKNSNGTKGGKERKEERGQEGREKEVKSHN